MRGLARLYNRVCEYVNIAGKSVFMRVLPYKDVVHAPDMDELIIRVHIH